MTPRKALIAGAACLIAAQLLASFALRPLRASTVSAKEVYTAVQPGEFAGTLLLGGFRGLACDLLWMRGTAAKDNRRFYESVAIFQMISRIQPRFEQIWEYMAWDMAYNISVEVDDEGGKWSWFLAGLDANVRGCRRNPGSERLLRHLAWMFHHKGDTFHERVLGADWAPLINPLIAELNLRLPADGQLAPLTPGPGHSNFRMSAYLYDAALKVAKAEGKHPPAFVRRMIPHAFEKDGNLWRNQGQHLRALSSYMDSLEHWHPLMVWLASPIADEQDRYDRELSIETTERNEGRVRRKTAELARTLAPDEATGEATAAAILARNDVEARRLIALPGWKASAARGGIHWLDERPAAAAP
jgi:hypothetical protein